MSIPQTNPLRGFAATDFELDAALRGLRDAPLNSVALATAAGNLLVETGAVAQVRVGSTYITVASGTDMPALVGTIPADKFNVFSFFLNMDGTFRTALGTVSDTLAGIVPAVQDQDEALLGHLIINPTGTGDFVGGTTAINDATVVPNAVYRNNVAPFVPALGIV